MRSSTQNPIVSYSKGLIQEWLGMVVDFWDRDTSLISKEGAQILSDESNVDKIMNRKFDDDAHKIIKVNLNGSEVEITS